MAASQSYKTTVNMLLRRHVYVPCYVFRADIKLPPRIRRYGRPKGQETTVTGLPKKRGTGRMLPFARVPTSWKERSKLHVWKGVKNAHACNAIMTYGSTQHFSSTVIVSLESMQSCYFAVVFIHGLPPLLSNFLILMEIVHWSQWLKQTNIGWQLSHSSFTSTSHSKKFMHFYTVKSFFFSVILSWFVGSDDADLALKSRERIYDAPGRMSCASATVCLHIWCSGHKARQKIFQRRRVESCWKCCEGKNWLSCQHVWRLRQWAWQTKHRLRWVFEMVWFQVRCAQSNFKSGKLVLPRMPINSTCIRQSNCLCGL